MNEQDQKIKEAIGIINYIKLRQAINKANNEQKKVYHVTKDKKTLNNKEIIQKNYPNIIIMTEKEWLTYAYQKLTPEEKKKLKKKIIAEMERK